MGNKTRSVFFLVLGLSLLVTVSSSRSVSAEYYSRDASQVKDFSVWKVGDLWHIFSIHVPASPPPGQGSPGLAHATSRDLNFWEEQGIAIPTGQTGSWDDYDIWAPSIVKNNETYYMFYAGVHQNNGQPEQRIGLATSTDLDHWTKSSSNPVFDCSSLSWTYINPNDIWDVGMECRDPFVTRDEANNRWVMYYTARSQHIDQAPLTSIENPAIVGMAYSTDLLSWHDLGPILATGGKKAESPHAFEHNGLWYLVWTNDCHFDGSTKCLQYATAGTMTGPYSQHQDIPELSWAYFASEYYRDGADEYFMYDLSSSIDFKRLSWNGQTMQFQSTPQGTIIGNVFLDTNENGIFDTEEQGVNNVYINYWYDNGDGEFHSGTEYPIISFPTVSAGVDGDGRAGMYYMPFIWPRQVWIEIASSAFAEGGKLFGLHSTNGPTAASITVQNGIENIGHNFGFAAPDTTPPSVVSTLVPS